MSYDPKIVKVLVLILSAAFTAAAQTGPVVLTSPDGTLEISIAKRRVDARTVMRLKLAPGGGSAIRLVSVQGEVQ